MMHEWRPEDSVKELILTSYPRGQTQVVRLGHLAGSILPLRMLEWVTCLMCTEFVFLLSDSCLMLFLGLLLMDWHFTPVVATG